MKHLLLILILAALATAGTPASAAAASRLSCPMVSQGPPCEEFWRADAVFVGVVTEAVAVDWSGTNLAPYSQYMRLTARLSVEEAFRGIDGAEVTFEMNDCPYPFKQGERYLVYASRDRDGKLYQRIGYTRTRPVSEAGDDLEYIRGLRQAREGGRIFGAVIRDVPDYKLRAGDASREARRGTGGAAAAGVKIVAEGEAQSYEATTDGEGKFEFPDLPAGAYKVRAAAPAGHSGGEVLKVTLPARACAPLRIYFVPAGEIAGRVTSADGRQVAKASVMLFSAEGVTQDALSNVEDRPPVMTYTDGEGRYHFVRLPAGRYYVLVSISASGEGEGKKTYLRTFFPHAGDLTGATAVTLGEGRKRTGVDVQVPPH